jgi:hypothetical protein
MQGVTDPNELGHIHDVSAAVALINLWEAAKCRGAVAMRWVSPGWVFSWATPIVVRREDTHARSNQDNSTGSGDNLCDVGGG